MKMKFKTYGLIIATSCLLSSCGTVGTGDPIVRDIIDVGAVGLALQYPEYTQEITALADVLNSNADSVQIKLIADRYISENIKDPALAAATSTLVDRVIERTTAGQRAKAVKLLASQMQESVATVAVE